jgi:hypothetical protein
MRLSSTSSRFLMLSFVQNWNFLGLALTLECHVSGSLAAGGRAGSWITPPCVGVPVQFFFCMAREADAGQQDI